MGMEMLVDLGWNCLDFGIREARVLDDCVDKGTLGQSDGTVLHSFDVYPNVIRWVTLIFDVEVKIAQLCDDARQLFV